MILRTRTKDHHSRWLEGAPSDKLSIVGEVAAAQFADDPETVWLFSGRVPKTIGEARQMVRDHEGTTDQAV